MSVTLRASVCVVGGTAGIEEWHLRRHCVCGNVHLHFTGSACLFRGHFLPPLLLLGQCPVHLCRSPVRPPRPTRNRHRSRTTCAARDSLVRFLFAEATEAHFLFRVHQVDCAHREFGEAVCPANRFPQRAWVADVHSTVTSTDHSARSNHSVFCGPTDCTAA